MLFSSVYKKAIAKRIAREAAPLPPFPYVCRDAQTKQIIARGSQAQMQAYCAAFGLCYVEAVS